MSARVLAEQMAKRYQRVGVLTEQNDYSASFLRDFSEYSKPAGMVLHNQDCQTNDTDFRTQILALKSHELDALFVNINTERGFSMVLRQLKELRASLPIYGAYLPGTAEFLKLAGDNAEGIIFVDFPFADQLLTAAGKQLYQEYLQRYGPMRSWDYAFPAVFEAFRALHLALESGKPAQQYLYQASFNGIFGEYSFDRNGDLVGLKPTMKVIRGGKAEVFQAQ